MHSHQFKLFKKHEVKVFILFFLVVLASIAYAVYHNYFYETPRIRVTLQRCVDGDTAVFNEVGTTRFLMVDTPETSTPEGKQVADFTCNLLKQATIIEISYDDNSSQTDRYNRTLAWVFVDGSLLQAKLASQGYLSRYFDNRGRATFNYRDVNLFPSYVNQVEQARKKNNSFWIE